MSARAAGLLVLASLLGMPDAARGDGGLLIFREERGPRIVSLFAEPVPLRAGPVRLEVLVQSRPTGDPIPTAFVRLRLRGPGESGPRVDAATEAGPNRLFRAARVELPAPGTWQVEVLVGEAAEGGSFRGELALAPPVGPLRRYAPYFAATLLALVGLAVHQALGLRRAGRRLS